MIFITNYKGQDFFYDEDTESFVWNGEHRPKLRDIKILIEFAAMGKKYDWLRVFFADELVVHKAQVLEYNDILYVKHAVYDTVLRWSGKNIHDMLIPNTEENVAWLKEARQIIKTKYLNWKKADKDLYTTLDKIFQRAEQYHDSK